MRKHIFPATFATAAILSVAVAQAQDEGLDDAAVEGETQIAAGVDSEKLAEARETVNETIEVIEQLKAEEGMAEMIDQARGVFILPDYAKVAALVGGQGGEGVAMLKLGEGADAEWSPPAFYNVGGASIGAEAGVKAGAMAMLLMNDGTADLFLTEESDWSLTADAGLTIVDYTTAVQAATGRGDVVVWSDTEGAFAGASVGVSNINQDEEENAAYYGEPVTVREILNGNVTTDRADELRQALAKLSDSETAEEEISAAEDDELLDEG